LQNSEKEFIAIKTYEIINSDKNDLVKTLITLKRRFLIKQCILNFLSENSYLDLNGSNIPLSDEFFELCAERHTSAVLNESDFKKHFKRVDKFNDMVKFIEEHSAESLTVSSVAEKFFVTPSYFAHFFKKKSGKSVIQYLNEVRILKARLLLEQEDISVSEVALQVGFDDINYFSRKFKQIIGLTPTDYKREYKK
jgi:YesN/AraC family two-component response regulator